MTKLYLEPQLEGRGYSAVLDYKDDDGYVSIGRTNEVARSSLDILFISLKLGDARIEMIGGPKELEAWKALQPEDRNCFMWDSLLRLMTPKLLRELLGKAEGHGRLLGRNQLQRELRALLGKSY